MNKETIIELYIKPRKGSKVHYEHEGVSYTIDDYYIDSIKNDNDDVTIDIIKVDKGDNG